MTERNVTRITTIRLLGFQAPQIISCLIFFFLLVVYCVTICGNLLIITLVVYSKTLHSPMYFFLSHLSISDIIMTTNILPNTLCAVLLKETTISFVGCLCQISVLSLAAGLEITLLTVMSYDRYLAICKPLHYASIMNQQLCWVMVSICWGLGIILQLNHSLALLMLQFCGPDVIDHFFCDLDPILELSCSDISNVHVELNIFGVIFLLPFFIIIVSYIYISIQIMQIPSITGKQKAFSTCSSHLSVVCMYFGTLACVYLAPNKGESMNINKFLSLLYTAGTPLMNPIIYSLRNKDLNQIVKTKLMSLHFKRQ